MTEPRPKPVEGVLRSWARPVAFALLALVLLLGYGLSRAGTLVPVEALARQLEGAGAAGMLGFLVAGAIATGVGLPRQAVALVAGYAYGAVAGLGLALAAAIGGCALTVAGSRRLLAPWVRGRYPAALARLAAFVEHDAFWKVLLLRFQPFGTNLLTNLSAGVLPLSLPTFLCASLLGYVPQTLVFVLAGSGLRVGSGTELAVSAALLAASVVLGAWLWRRHRGRSP